MHSCNHDPFRQTRSILSFKQSRPHYGLDLIGVRVWGVESRVHIVFEYAWVVVNDDGRVLHGERPGDRHALLDVLNQPRARLQTRVVVQGGKYLTAYLLQNKYLNSFSNFLIKLIFWKSN